MDRLEYNRKFNPSLVTETPMNYYIAGSPFLRIESDLNAKFLTLKKQGKIDDSVYFKLRSTDGTPSAICGSIKHHK